MKMVPCFLTQPPNTPTLSPPQVERSVQRGRKVHKDGVCSATAASGLPPKCQLLQREPGNLILANHIRALFADICVQSFLEQQVASYSRLGG